MKINVPMIVRLGFGAAALGLAACNSGGGAQTGTETQGVTDVDHADGTSSAGQVIGRDVNSDTGFPNDGSVGGSILQAGSLIAGNFSSPEKGFVCRQSASFDNGAYIEVGANGLVGGLLGGVLSLLSGDSLNNLLNGVSDTVLAMDGDLRTAAAVTQAISGLGGVLNSMDVTVNLPDGQFVKPGGYAVFAVSFPGSLLELGLLSTVTVQTYFRDSLQEYGALIDTSALSLLGVSTNQLGLGNHYALVGYKTSKYYDKAQLSIGNGLISIDLGEKLYIHEFCTGGELVTPPAQ